MRLIQACLAPLRDAPGYSELIASHPLARIGTSRGGMLKYRPAALSALAGYDTDNDLVQRIDPLSSLSRNPDVRHFSVVALFQPVELAFPR